MDGGSVCSGSSGGGGGAHVQGQRVGRDAGEGYVLRRKFAESYLDG